ncbi:Phage tail fiber protein [Salmonella enterica subsp. arizonae]|nr:Phage tail fiber protein [Salmonella enterica subsp. arizonae]
MGTGNAGTELHHSAEGQPDQYDGGREYGGIGNPDDAGRYSMDVEQGQYTVTLLVEGVSPVTMPALLRSTMIPNRAP